MPKTVIVSGGSRGIGRAVCERFAALGYTVAFCYRQNEAAANELCARLPDAMAYRLDVADSAAVNGMIADVIKKTGRIDALVCNAGIAGQRLFTDISDEQWKRMIDVNLNGVFYFCRAVLPHMIAKKSGRIVTVSSMWGISGGSCEVHYSAAKAGVIGLTKALAKEVGPSGICVNCVAPGVIDTDMNSALGPDDIRGLVDSTPLCRIGSPSDVAAAIAFLCSDDARFITGQVLGADGGIIA